MNNLGSERAASRVPGGRADGEALAVDALAGSATARSPGSLLRRLRSTDGTEAQRALLQLQRQYGNRHAMRTLELARQGPPEKKEEEVVGRKANVARQNEQESQDAVAPLVEAAITRKRGGGQPLERKTRAQMEPAFGADFGGVRVHGDAEADRLNRVLNARAFTVGTDIFFRHGEYSPDSAEGQKLLAHELTHALQQGGGQVRRTPAGIQRLCAECEAERQGLTAPPQQWQAKLTVSAPEDADEREADRVAQTVMGHLQRQGQEGEEQEQEEEDRRRMTAAKGGRGPRGRAGEEEEEEPPVQAKRTEVLLYRQAEEREQSGQEPPTKAGANALFRQVSGGLPSGEVVQRVPQPGRNFGTRSYCGFGITTRIPGFIQSHMQDNFDVDYTTGCSFIWWNAWSSVWELYDASDDRKDSNTESPFGGYSITPANIRAGTAGNGKQQWSLWYRITDSQPWLTDDNDAYPYDFVTFDVYETPLANHAVEPRREYGDVIWEREIVPAEDGASLRLTFAERSERTTTETQSSTVNVSVGGDRSASLTVPFEGLQGEFANRLSWSVAAEIVRTRGSEISVSDERTEEFSQSDLRGGVTYAIRTQPIYRIIDGSVGLLRHRDGVIISGGPEQLRGSIRIFSGLRTEMIPIEEGGAETQARGDTGNCTEEEHRRLQNEVNRQCKQLPRACRESDDCRTLKRSWHRNERCAKAREKINDKCFNGGDAGHRRAAQEARRAEANCREIYRRKGC